MDYHFVKPVDDEENKVDLSRLMSFVKKLSPLVVLSAVLPVFLFFLYNPPETTFAPRANIEPTLRVWFEPNTILVSSGRNYKVNVYGALDNAEGFVIENLKFKLFGGPTRDIEFVSETPFSNQTLLGTVEIYPETSGEYLINIDESSFSYSPANSQIKPNLGNFSIVVK